MIKIPMAFKGPKGQIKQLFHEEKVYKATQLLLNGNLIKWHHKESLEMINAKIQDDQKLYSLNITWPITHSFDATIGTCTCDQKYPCIHIAALVIASKSKLDQLPPFTQQIQASKNIAETFSNWLNRQHYDPYPNMARHRLIYILDFDDVNKTFNICMHKAYISTEGRYTLKAKLDSSLYYSSNLPKFVTLSDQRILKLMIDNSLLSQHKFTISKNRDDELFHEILLTGRCFWKACYRTPLEYNQDVNIINPGSLLIINNTFLSMNNNSVVKKNDVYSQPIKIDVSQSKITPHICIKSYQIGIETSEKIYFDIDVAKISFIHQNREFSFADLSYGKILPETNLLNQMAGYLRQIENLDSLNAHFEQTVLAGFHLNDRYISQCFSDYACLLVGLQNDGWKVSIDDSYRLNQTVSNDWFTKLTSHNNSKTSQSDLNSNWFDLELGVTIDGKSINILPYLVNAISSGKLLENSNKNFNIKLEDGTNIGLNNTVLKKIISTLSELYDESSLNKNKSLTLSNSQLLRVNQLTKSLNNKDKKNDQSSNISLKWQGDSWLKQKALELDQGLGLLEIATPKNLKTTLRGYQKTGFAWLQFLSQYGLGGILADDMGLGKTLQVLTHILHEKNSGHLKSPCLIVVPTSLLSNWQSEIQKFTPSLSSLVFSGNNRDKHYKIIDNIDIVIMSYGVMIRDKKELLKCNFHMHILDEAQAIKNAKTSAAKVASTIKSMQRICLSGTPIENHLGELWSLFNFLMPGFLGSKKQFEHIYQIPIEKAGDQDRKNDLSKRVSPFMLRRTKSLVAKELPDKTEIVQIIELNEEQANLYETIRLTMNEEIKQAMQKTQSKNHGMNQGNNKFIIGNALLRLRQVCCHPALLNLDSIIEHHDSAKLNWLTTVLPNMIEEGNRILLFSSFTSMLDIIEEHLKQMKIETLKLTGKTPANKRGELVDKFQAGNVSVFLISLKAGGSGLNLTTADTVIHFDPWWNPAAESQASDRAHRIGQDKNVFVYKLITKGTVEQKIQQLQLQKHALAQSIFDGQGNMTSILNDGKWQEFLKPIE